MKEICLLNDSFPPFIDGVANTVVNYARVISENGGQVSVITPDAKGADDSKFNYPVIRYPSVELKKFYGYAAGNPIPIATLKQYATHDVDIIHCHCPVVSCVVARELREILNAPMILTYHTMFDQDINKTFKGETAREIAIRSLVDNLSACDELWAVSKGAGDSIKALGYPGDYVVMENGVDLPRQRADESAIKEATEGYDLPEGVPTFVFVGRMMWYKGVRIILDALSILNSRNIDFRMILIGAGTDEEDVKDYIKKLHLDNKVFLTGAIRDRQKLVAWYSRADLFLFPSTYDTNGLVVREAAACGLGSVLIKGSCAAEGVTDGVDALLSDENAESFAEVLAGVAGNRDRMRQIGEMASKNLYISWDDAVKKAMDRYQIVSDRYKSGKIKKKKGIAEEVFSIAGEMMRMEHIFHGMLDEA